MQYVSIIGSAGRKDDKDRWTVEMYNAVKQDAMKKIKQYMVEDYTVKSGGAALIDHIAVSLFLAGQVPRLELFLPASFQNGRYLAASADYKDPGNISNYYHGLFSQKLGRNSLTELQQAFDEGAVKYIVPGFYNRNRYVGETNLLLAYTFGTHSSINTSEQPGWSSAEKAGLKDGGTAHTWESSKAKLKIHTALQELHGT